MRIISIITLFNPGETVIENVRRVSEQSDLTILVDNSNKNNSELIGSLSNVKYIANLKNLGLSMAFNKVLKEKKFEWNEDDFVLFFDQDSKIKPNHVKCLIDKFNYVRSKGVNVGCIGPVYYNTSNNTVEIPKIKNDLNNEDMIVSSIITSSMLTTYGILKKIGFWNEEIFLDMADWDLCWRLMKYNYKCVMTKAVVLEHSLGEGEKKLLFFSLRIGKPFREYYQIRDCQYLLEKDYIPTKYRIRFHLILTLRSLLHLLFLNDRKERIKYMKMGYKDYKKRVRGEIRTKSV
ncbi:glycosyltransferase [Ruminococcus flavefaciens]|uniref:glycosyltransferase n=1 Tax=Ruminococcus flavefaciens TaxID=1265 RepID=UPI0026EBACFD|nr:glycosyltransferase [Ruminococcus flavefaciens]